jgi:hypothetical protein
MKRIFLAQNRDKREHLEYKIIIFRISKNRGSFLNTSVIIRYSSRKLLCRVS